MFAVKNQELIFNEIPILSNLPFGTSINKENKSIERGVFLKFSKKEPFSVTFWEGIKINNLRRFTALYHREPFWITPTFGYREDQILSHTAAMWIERKDNLRVILIPIIDKGYRTFIKGSKSGFNLMVDNNCTWGKESQITALYIGINEDPYIMMEEAAKHVSNRINVGKLRKEKVLPEWIDKLGYCTWNSFYGKITAEKLVRMLNVFKKAGILPRFVLLDDGWQLVRLFALMDKGVIAKKFPDGLKKLVEFCKTKFKTEDFIVWHTFQGYWGGLNIHGKYRKKFKKSFIKTKLYMGPSYPESGDRLAKLFKIGTNYLLPLFARQGILPPKEMGEFYDDYHSWLRTQGIDGVKVDNQSSLSSYLYNRGNQADLMRQYHKVLEESVERNFTEGSIINCMSMGTDVIFQTVKSNITRNSQDYFPKIDKFHAEGEVWQIYHVVFNSYNDFFTQHFVHPDWDMFQTANKMGWGEYQGASRAISGSPICVSDDPYEIDIEVLKKVSLPNGRILRCEGIALPTRDCLFKNPAKPGRALKIFNRNKFNSILGIFSALLKKSTTIKYGPSDINGYSTGQFAVYEFNSGTLTLMSADETVDLMLYEKGFEIFTISPIKGGFAPIGLLSMYNSGGIFEKIELMGSKISIRLKFGGTIGFYSEKEPQDVLVNGIKIAHMYNSSNKFLKVSVPLEEAQMVDVLF